MTEERSLKEGSRASESTSVTEKPGLGCRAEVRKASPHLENEEIFYCLSELRRGLRRHMLVKAFTHALSLLRVIDVPHCPYRILFEFCYKHGSANYPSAHSFLNSAIIY